MPDVSATFTIFGYTFHVSLSVDFRVQFSINWSAYVTDRQNTYTHGIRGGFHNSPIHRCPYQLVNGRRVPRPPFIPHDPHAINPNQEVRIGEDYNM